MDAWYLRGEGSREEVRIRIRLRGREFFRGLSPCYGGRVSTKGGLIGEVWL